jgi:hypothetical protein
LPLYGVFVISVCQSVANLAENIWSSPVNFYCRVYFGKVLQSMHG